MPRHSLLACDRTAATSTANIPRALAARIRVAAAAQGVTGLDVLHRAVDAHLPTLEAQCKDGRGIPITSRQVRQPGGFTCVTYKLPIQLYQRFEHVAKHLVTEIEGGYMVPYKRGPKDTGKSWVVAECLRRYLRTTPDVEVDPSAGPADPTRTMFLPLPQNLWRWLHNTGHQNLSRHVRDAITTYLPTLLQPRETPITRHSAAIPPGTAVSNAAVRMPVRLHTQLREATQALPGTTMTSLTRLCVALYVRAAVAQAANPKES